MAASTKTATAVWSLEKEDELAVLWSEYPCLYDVKSKEYRDRVAKELALKEIGQKVEMTADQVSTRMKSLRTQYGKLIKPLPSGSAARPKTSKNNWIIDNLAFLAPHMGYRQTSSNLQLTDEDEIHDDCGDRESENGEASEDESNTSSICPTPTPPSRPNSRNSDVPADTTPRSTKRPLNEKVSVKKAKKQREEKEMVILDGLTKFLMGSTESQDDPPITEVQAFCQYLEKSFKKFDANTFSVLRHKINNLIFDAEQGILTQPVQPVASQFNQQTHHNFQGHGYNQEFGQHPGSLLQELGTCTQQDQSSTNAFFGHP